MPLFQASLLRSQAPVHKKTGKQIMFRSEPTSKPWYMDFRNFNAPILGFKVLGFGF